MYVGRLFCVKKGNILTKCWTLWISPRRIEQACVKDTDHTLYLKWEISKILNIIQKFKITQTMPKFLSFQRFQMWLYKVCNQADYTSDCSTTLNGFWSPWSDKSCLAWIDLPLSKSPLCPISASTCQDTTHCRRHCVFWHETTYCVNQPIATCY